MNPILFENYLALPESLRGRYLQQLYPNEGDRVQFLADLNAYLLGGSSNTNEDSQVVDGNIGGTGTIPLSTAVVNINYCENLVNLRTQSVTITYNSTERDSLDREVSNAISFFVNNNIPFRYAVNQEAPPLTCFIPTFSLPTPTPIPSISPTSTIEITPITTRIPRVTPTPIPSISPTSTIEITPITTRIPRVTPTVIEPQPSNDQYFLLRECTNDGSLGAEVYTQIRGDEAQRFVDVSLSTSPTTRYYYFVDGSDRRFGLPPKNYNPNLRPIAGQYGCPSGGSIIITPTLPPPPPPGEDVVSITFLSVIAEDLAEIIRSRCGRSLDPMLGSLNLGSIILDGVSIGSGQATATLVVGTTHTVVFNKPSHPYFTFSDGSPSSYTFTVSQYQTRLESYFYPSFSKIRGSLSVRVNVTPNISGLNIKPKVFITNVGQIGEGSINDYSLDTGDYTLYFEPIKVAGMIFVTPPERKISINICSPTTVDVNYTGVALPTNYWLKKIDSIDQMKYNSVITKGMFSNGIANMVSFYTSSISDSIDNYYTHIYHERLSYPTSSVQFSLAYGHIEGSGSNDEGGQYNDTPTRAIYGQYKNIIVGNSQDRLNLSGTPTKHFYVVSYQKDRRDTRADYNALELNIAHLSGSQFIASSNMRYHTGSNVELGGQGKVLRLISDYKINDNPQKATPSAPLEYNIVSGSIEDGVYNTSNPHYYGKLYPSLGVVLLDANKLDVSASFGTVTSREIDGKNQLKLFTAISGAALYTDISGDKLGMKARATKEELTYYYYIHVKNKEFNFSNNPSIYNTDGLQYLQYGVPNDVSVAPEILDNTAVLNSTFIDRPTTYITTIGLYDDNRNLIAVGKVSKAELNNFTEEVVFTVKLKF